MTHPAEDTNNRLLASLIAGFKLAPFEFLIAGFAVIWASLALHSQGTYVEYAPEVATACALSFVGALILSALHRFGGIGNRERLLATAVGCGIFGAMSGFVLDLELQTNIWRIGLLVGALACVLPLTPLARADADESMNVWRFTLNLSTRSIVALAYGFAMQAAVTIAFIALDELFALQLDDGFAQVGIILFVGFVPCFVVSGLDTMATESTIADSLSKSMLERAGKWLVAPALATYLTIIYAYTAKVVLTGEAPENVLSPLALGAATLGLVAIFFFEPMVRKERPDWFSSFVRWLPLGLLAGLPLATWAIWQRIDQHGWTEFRYFRLLLVAGFGLVFVLTPWIRRHRERFVLRVGPAVFGVLFILASIGPFSASSVSRDSQLDYLRDDLHTAGLDLRGGLDDEVLTDVSREVRDSISSRVRYLRDMHGDRTLAHLAGDQDITDLLDQLSITGPAYVDSAPQKSTYARAETQSPLTLSRASRVVGANIYNGSSVDQKGWQLTLEGDEIEVQTGTEFLQADIEPILEHIDAQLADGRSVATIEKAHGAVPLVDKSGEIQGELFVMSAQLRRDSDEWSITSLDVAAAVYE